MLRRVLCCLPLMLVLIFRCFNRPCTFLPLLKLFPPSGWSVEKGLPLYHQPTHTQQGFRLCFPWRWCGTLVAFYWGWRKRAAREFSLSHSPTTGSLGKTGAGFVRRLLSHRHRRGAQSECLYSLQTRARQQALPGVGVGSGKFEYGDDKKNIFEDV